jgi:hypothetical protein
MIADDPRFLSRWTFSVTFKEISLPEMNELNDEECTLDDPTKLVTLRVFDNFRSGDSCDFDISCVEKRSELTGRALERW